MTLNGYSSDDAVRQIRYADGLAKDKTDAGRGLWLANHYLRAIAVSLAAIAARMEE